MHCINIPPVICAGQMFWIYDVNANGPWNSEKTVDRHLEMLEVLKTSRWVNNKVP